MVERILRLCKRLNKFSSDEIETISEIDGFELQPILDKLVSEKKLLKQGDTYFYNKKVSMNKQISKLPFLFNFHNKETIDLIIRCFCAEIPAYKSAYLVALSDSIVCNFYTTFKK